MYVCLCNRVNDRQIKKLAEAGVDSIEELQQRTTLGNGCGCCVMEAEELLTEYRAMACCRLQKAPVAATPLSLNPAV